MLEKGRNREGWLGFHHPLILQYSVFVAFFLYEGHRKRIVLVNPLLGGRHTCYTRSNLEKGYNRMIQIASQARLRKHLSVEETQVFPILQYPRLSSHPKF